MAHDCATQGRLTDAALERLLEQLTDSATLDQVVIAKNALHSLAVELRGWRHPVYPAVTLTPVEIAHLVFALAYETLEGRDETYRARHDHLMAVLLEARDATN